MAAIIAQLSRANWERKRNKKKQIPPDKSSVVLPPFDERFVPNIHNKYLRSKISTNARQREEKLEFVGQVVESAKHNMLDDRLKMLSKNLQKIRNSKSDNQDKSEIMDFVKQRKKRKEFCVEAFKAAAAIAFVGIFIVTFVFLLAMFSYIETH